jgi:mono/diheme cytochrome c family protein
MPSPSVEVGAAIFRKNCAGCHSLEPGRRTNAPSLAGYFARNPSPTSRQTEELIMNGRRLMPPFRHRLSSDQIGDVIAFMKAQ